MQSNRFVTVATTRPETMLGDMAVAVHPDDERLKRSDRQSGIATARHRPILIIADEYSDPEKGTGAVKITPAHDFNDFEVWKRYVARISDTNRRRFEDEVNYRSVDDLINILTPEAKLKSSARDDHEATKRAAWPMPEHIRDFNRQLRDTNLENDSLSAGLEDFNLIPLEFRGLDRFEARKKLWNALRPAVYSKKSNRLHTACRMATDPVR